MEADLTYYGTIGALASISIAFYWLHKNDHDTTQLAEEDIRAGKLVVVVVNSNHPFRYKLKPLLEQKGFIIYDIVLNKQKQMSVDETSITINSECSNQIGEATKFIKSKLDGNKQKLHAYLTLPITSIESSDLLEAPKQVMQELLLPKFSLLSSLLNIICEHQARVIHIQVANNLLCNDLSKLIHSLESSINSFLCKQLPKQVAKNFIEVNVRESDVGSIMDALLNPFAWASGMVSSVVEAMLRQLELEGSFVDCLTPGREIISSRARDNNRTTKGKGCALDPFRRERIDEKFIQAIEGLVSKAFI